MKAYERYNKLFEQSEQSPEFRIERAILDLTEDLPAPWECFRRVRTKEEAEGLRDLQKFARKQRPFRELMNGENS